VDYTICGCFQALAWEYAEDNSHGEVGRQKCQEPCEHPVSVWVTLDEKSAF